MANRELPHHDLRVARRAHRRAPLDQWASFHDGRFRPGASSDPRVWFRSIRSFRTGRRNFARAGLGRANPPRRRLRSGRAGEARRALPRPAFPSPSSAKRRARHFDTRPANDETIRAYPSGCAKHPVSVFRRLPGGSTVSDTVTRGALDPSGCPERVVRRAPWGVLLLASQVEPLHALRDAGRFDTSDGATRCRAPLPP